MFHMKQFIIYNLYCFERKKKFHVEQVININFYVSHETFLVGKINNERLLVDF